VYLYLTISKSFALHLSYVVITRVKGRGKRLESKLNLFRADCFVLRPTLRQTRCSYTQTRCSYTRQTRCSFTRHNLLVPTSYFAQQIIRAVTASTIYCLLNLVNLPLLRPFVSQC
jgi:hypothetical protein